MKRLLPFITFSILYFFFSNVVAQKDSVSTKHKKKKFEFDLLEYEKTKKLKEGKYIHVKSFVGDSIIFHEGNLTNLSNDSIFLDIMTEKIVIGDENKVGEQLIHYQIKEFPENEKMGIPIIKNQEITYYSTAYNISASFFIGSILSGVILAPLVSINKSKPHNFNTKRYVDVVKYSFLSAAVFCSFTIITTSPKLKAKPNLY